MAWQAAPRVIRRRRGLERFRPAEVWAYRDLLWLLGARELRLRYRQTALGVAWVVLQPLLGAAVIAFVFGRVAGLQTAGTPYFVLAFTGLLGWSLFHATLTKATSCLVHQPQLVTKVSFPRVIIPLSTAIAPLVDFGVSLAALAVVLPFTVGLHLSLLAAPLWALALLALTLGAGLALSSLAVRYRDVPHMLPFVLQLLLFACPVAYSMDAVPERWRAVYRLNPLAVLIEGLRDVCLGRPVAWDAATVLAFGAAGALFLGGWLVFASAERQFADVI
jgi:lipopolysaccharide transport system permease protein